MGFVTFLLKNLFRRKARSLLTGVAVAVAVGTTVALLGISDGFRRSNVDSFEKRGVDLVVVDRDKPDQISSDLAESVGDRILQIPGVRAVGPGLVDVISIRKGKNDQSVMVNGWNPDGLQMKDIKVDSGRPLTLSDRRAALLGWKLARDLRKSVGDTVEIQGEDFTVVGVFTGVSVYEDGAVVVPLHEFQQLRAREGRVTGFNVVLDDTGGKEDRLESVREQIEALEDHRGRSLRLSAKATPEYVNSSLHIKAANAMAWLTSVIAVVIGAIGMLNTMIMSVFERTKEIGILRAIGWRRARVVRMILGESVLLSLAGAVLGVVGAVLLARWLTTFPMVSGYVQGDIAPFVMAEGFAMAVVVGLIGGLYPAYRAAGLLPTEALRHE